MCLGWRPHPSVDVLPSAARSSLARFSSAQAGPLRAPASPGRHPAPPSRSPVLFPPLYWLRQGKWAGPASQALTRGAGAEEGALHASFVTSRGSDNPFHLAGPPIGSPRARAPGPRPVAGEGGSARAASWTAVLGLAVSSQKRKHLGGLRHLCAQGRLPSRLLPCSGRGSASSWLLCGTRVVRDRLA